MAVPGLLAIIATIVSIVVKRSCFSIPDGRQESSLFGLRFLTGLTGDVLATTGSNQHPLSRMGYRRRSIAAIIIALFIFRVGVQVFRDGADQMVDRACKEETVQQIRSVILDQEGVRGLDLLRTRTFGSRCYVDVEISADGLQSLVDAHSIAERVHHAIEKNFPQVKHCMVHVNPSKKKR